MPSKQPGYVLLPSTKAKPRNKPKTKPKTKPPSSSSAEPSSPPDPRASDRPYKRGRYRSPSPSPPSSPEDKTKSTHDPILDILHLPMDRRLSETHDAGRERNGAGGADIVMAEDDAETASANTTSAPDAPQPTTRPSCLRCTRASALCFCAARAGAGRTGTWCAGGAVDEHGVWMRADELAARDEGDFAWEEPLA